MTELEFNFKLKHSVCTEEVVKFKVLMNWLIISNTGIPFYQSPIDYSYSYDAINNILSIIKNTTLPKSITHKYIVYLTDKLSIV